MTPSYLESEIEAQHEDICHLLEASAKAAAQKAQAEEVERHRLGVDMYDQLRPLLMVRLRGLGLTTENAEDVVHETFLRLLEHLRGTEGNENLRGWIFRVAYNLAMDIHRSEKHRSHPTTDLLEAAEAGFWDPVDPSPGPEEMAIQAQGFSRLRSAFSLLTFQQRKCLMLRAQGLRYREIASTLGISSQRAAKLLKRGTTLVAASL
jgi:RNA polymerase sigma-70 factor (ECF subfamily)